MAKANRYDLLRAKLDQGPEKEEPGEKEPKSSTKKKERAEERAEGKS